MQEKYAPTREECHTLVSSPLKRRRLPACPAPPSTSFQLGRCLTQAIGETIIFSRHPIEGLPRRQGAQRAAHVGREVCQTDDVAGIHPAEPKFP